MALRLSGWADADLARIYAEGIRLFGLDQAARYHERVKQALDLIAHSPGIARERREFTPPVRVHPCGSHVILYLVRPDGDVLVLRVRHAREDWLREDWASAG